MEATTKLSVYYSPYRSSTGTPFAQVSLREFTQLTSNRGCICSSLKLIFARSRRYVYASSVLGNLSYHSYKRIVICLLQFLQSTFCTCFLHAYINYNNSTFISCQLLTIAYYLTYRIFSIIQFPPEKYYFKKNTVHAVSAKVFSLPLYYNNCLVSNEILYFNC